MLSRLKSNNFLIVLFLALVSVSISYFSGDGNRNLLLIGLMAFSPFVVLTSKKAYKDDLLLISFLLIIILPQYLMYPETTRWSTILYTAMFCFTFMAYFRICRSSSMSILRYQSIIKILIYAYTAVLIIQQFCVLTGLPIINVSNYSPENPWKLNSLSSEPSHSSVYLAVLMYSFIITRESQINHKYNLIKYFRADYVVWLCFLWSMLSMKSATAFIYLFFLILKFVNKKNIIAVFIVFISFYSISTTINSTALSRAKKTAVAILTFDTKAIIDADHSASYRIVPTLFAFKIIDLETSDGWFGKGVDYMKDDLQNQIPGTSEDPSIGSMFTFAVDYGIIPFFIFLIFSIRMCFDRKQFFSIVFLIFGVFLNSINTQVLWFVIIFLFTNKNITKQKLKKNK